MRQPSRLDQARLKFVGLKNEISVPIYLYLSNVGAVLLNPMLGRLFKYLSYKCFNAGQSRHFFFYTCYINSVLCSYLYIDYFCPCNIYIIYT